MTPAQPEEAEGVHRSGSWHIRKEISLGDMAVIISAMTAILFAYSTLDKRISLVEQAIVLQKDRDERQDDGVVRTRDRLEKALSAINEKLDWLIRDQVSEVKRRGK